MPACLDTPGTAHHGSLVKSVYFVSLGCPKNRVDTEVMLGLVDGGGLRVVGEPEKADVIVVNTCGFIGEAKQESVDTILEMGRYKEAGEGRCERLVVTGCLSQRYAGDLRKELPEVDVFMARARSTRSSPPSTARAPSPT